jgi:Holliday junction resolvase RusA-like endonuclease
MVALSKETDFVVDLPYPPSINRIWRSNPRASTTGKQVYIAPSYRSWKDQASLALLQKRGWIMRRIKGSFSVELALCPPKGHPRGDLDNRIKAVLDFLQQATVIENDKHCQMICAYWAPWSNGFECRVTVKPWSPQEAPTVNDVLRGALQRMEAS